ncbi:MAG: carboxypeptidase regulatory-like domain-containing protein, partial [Planctomycetota bacterium]
MQRLLPALLLLVALCAAAFYLVFQTWESPADPLDSGFVPAEVEAVAADNLAAEEVLEAASLESDAELSRAELAEAESARLDTRDEQETAWVNAQLVEPSGRAVVGGVLRAEEERPFRSGKFLGEGTSGAQGKVRVEVPSGQPVSLYSSGDLWTSQSFQLAALRPGEELDLGALILAPADILQGQVLDPSGNPVTDAKVRLRESGSSLMASSSVNLGATTDAEGRFHIGGVPTGVYRLSGSADGYSSGIQDPVVIAGKGSTLDMDLHLGTGFEVRGVVLDADDRPVAGVFVSPQRSLWESDFELMEFADLEDGEVPSAAAPRGVRTDARGKFNLTGLEEEIDTLMVRGSGYATQRFAVPEEGQDAVVHLVSSLSISGIVIGTDGEPVAGAELSLKQRNFFEADFVDPWQPSARTTSKADGTFVIPDLGPGDYRLTALEEYGQVLDRPLALEQDLTDLKVQMEPARHLIVQVSDPEGNPVVGAKVEVHEAGRGGAWGEFEVNINHGSDEDGERSGARVSSLGGGFRATTDGSGRALLFGVPAGPFEADVKAKGFADFTHAFERLEDAQEERVLLTPATELVV